MWARVDCCSARTAARVGRVGLGTRYWERREVVASGAWLVMPSMRLGEDSDLAAARKVGSARAS